MKSDLTILGPDLPGSVLVSTLRENLEVWMESELDLCHVHYTSVARPEGVQTVRSHDAWQPCTNHVFGRIQLN